MLEQRRIVFISCGQFTDEERALGEQARKLVDELTPFAGYFAQDEVSLEMLSRNVLNQLYESVGLIAIMHHRGSVETREHKVIRASVWIEQEVAIAALMQQVLNRRLHVALFTQHGIGLEGIRQQLHLNPIEFKNGEEVIARLREILPQWKEPLYTSEDEIREQVQSVELSVGVVLGRNLTLTIEVKNHSDIDVKVERIVLRCLNAKLCNPIDRPHSANWTVVARGGTTMQLATSENVGHKLIGICGRRQTAVNLAFIHDPSNRFPAVISAEFQCRILRAKRIIKEDCPVEVNLTSGEISRPGE